MGRVRAFDDPLSFIHMLYAAAVAYLSPTALVAASIIYYAYQSIEKEKLSRKRGDYVEWLVGILVGLIIRAITM